MNPHFFLRIKHWQIFLILVGSYFFLGIVGAAFIDPFAIDQVGLRNNDPASVIAMFEQMRWVYRLMLIPIFIQFAYFWSVGLGMQNYLPEGFSMKTTRFKIFIIIPMIFTVIMMVFIVDFMEYMIMLQLTQGRVPAPVPAVFFLVIPLYFLSIFGVIHTIYFVAKATKSAEMKSRARFADYVGYFFLIVFYPIGIWFFQPRVNEISSRPLNEHTIGDDPKDIVV